jgi:hypothetical protein
MPNVPGAEHIGSLHENLTSLAGKVFQCLIDGPRTVWAEDDGRVFASAPAHSEHVPTSWIAGTYSFYQPSQSIEEDLRELLQERRKSWASD